MNRTVSVRVPAHNKKRPETKRIEYRPPDSTSNVYLVESALLLAGVDGIKKKIQPPDPVDVNTYKLSQSEMKKLSVEKLPTSLKESIDAFSSDNDFLKPEFELKRVSAGEPGEEKLYVLYEVFPKPEK